MFKAIGRYARAFGYLITGRIDAARRELSSNPYVVRATYEKVIQEKTKRIHQYKDAVAGLITQEEKKIARVRQLTTETGRLEQLKEGAAAKARKIVEQLKAKGISMEEIKKDEDYLACLAAYNDFSSTAAEKSGRIAELEQDVTQISSSVASHKIQLQQLVREIDSLKEETHEAVADMITAKEEQELSDMLSGISEDSTSKELQELRDMRQQQKAGARVSRELAGTDSARMEAEFLEYARTTGASDEFDRLIGLAGETDAAPDVADRAPDTRLPE